MENEGYILRNKRFEAKLCYYRLQALKMADQIASFVEDQVNFKLPSSKKLAEKLATNRKDEVAEFCSEYMEVINLHYLLKSSGLSLAALFSKNTDSKTTLATTTLMHFYSKHRVDPVWNWRKSAMVRNAYRKYITETKLYRNTHPLHVVLTLKREKGKHKGERFYGQKLIKYYNELRKLPFWKKYVVGGEYGIEIKKSITGGFHIHVHSLVLMHKGLKVNDFRDELKRNWELLTGATQIWCETLYFHKKDEQGRYIVEDLRQGSFEDHDEYTCNEITGKVRKKFYIDKEISNIEKNNKLTPDEKEAEIVSTYLFGTLECIKYHFKQDAMFQDDSDLYDIELMNEVLTKTKNNRLYSRFGSLRGEASLDFNNPNRKKKNDEADEEETEEIMAKVSEVVINPFTGEETPPEEVQFVLYRPETRRYNSKNSIKPYETYDNDTNLFTRIYNKDIKLIVKMIVKGQLGALLLPPEFTEDKPINKDEINELILINNN